MADTPSTKSWKLPSGGRRQLRGAPGLFSCLSVSYARRTHRERYGRSQATYTYVLKHTVALNGVSVPGAQAPRPGARLP